MSTTCARRTRPDSLMGRVQAFFEANPDEWLTLDDGAAKFDCTPTQFYRVVENLKCYGIAELEVVRVVRVKAA